MITLCYIVRDERMALQKSIASCAGCYDELVVVDTGSTDGTIELAEMLGARVISFPWQDDFSAARNFAIEQCQGDWILFLDADEYFAEGSAVHIPMAVSKAQQANVPALLIWRRDVDYDNYGEMLAELYVMRLFRRDSQFRYEGLIHEQLCERGKEIQNVAAVPRDRCCLIHTGYSGKLSRNKAERNLRILLKELRQTVRPQRLYGFLADAYYGLADNEQALHYAWLDVRLGRRMVTYASRSWRILLHLLADRRDKYFERLAAVKSAVQEFPEIAEFHAEYAECLAEAQLYEKAGQEAEKAIRTFQDYRGIEPMFFNEEMAALLMKRASDWNDRKKGEHSAVSVIVPVYNAGDWLRPCLESILGQTFKNFELILVEDHSLDNSFSICQEVAALPKVRLLRTEKNSGAAVARNVGLQAASGKYVTFIDADDEVELDYLANLYRAAEESGAEVVLMGCKSREENTASEAVWQEYPITNREYLLPTDIHSRVKALFQQILPTVPWGRLIRRDFLITHGIYFRDMKYYEDSLFQIPVLIEADKYLLLPATKYHYRVHGNSVTHLGTIEERIKNYISSCIKAFQWLQLYIRKSDKIKHSPVIRSMLELYFMDYLFKGPMREAVGKLPLEKIQLVVDDVTQLEFRENADFVALLMMKCLHNNHTP